MYLPVLYSVLVQGAAVDLETLSKQKVSWCCWVRHLITALEQMTDVKQTLVPGKILIYSHGAIKESNFQAACQSVNASMNILQEKMHLLSVQ